MVLLRVNRGADARGLGVVGSQRAAQRIAHVLLAVHDRAVHQAPQVRCLARDAVFLDAQHAVEAARGDTHIALVAKAVVRRAGADAEKYGQAAEVRHPSQRSKAQRRQDRERHQTDAELEVAREDERRHDGDQQAAERAAGGDAQIEGGEVLRRRPRAVELAVAEKAADEHSRQKHPELQREVIVVVGIDQQPCHRDERDQEQRPQPARPIPALAFEGDDEGREIQRERHEP